MRKSTSLKVAIPTTLLAFIVFASLPFFSENTKEAQSISFATKDTKSDEFELGESNVEQKGVNGERIVTYTAPRNLFNVVFGGTSGSKAEVSSLSAISKEPVSELVTVGTKKYQYMYCSDGNYRYYNDDQFKDPNTGFIHKSKDYCAANNQGTMTQLADSPIVRRTVSINTVTPFYFPNNTYSSQSTTNQYPPATPLFNPLPLRQSPPPTPLPIKVTPAHPCTYYVWNPGVCYHN